MKMQRTELKNADTKTEKILLAFLKRKSQEINYGTVNIEFTIKNGEVTFMRSVREEETFTFSPDNR